MAQPWKARDDDGSGKGRLLVAVPRTLTDRTKKAE